MALVITRLSGGTTPADGSDPRTYPAIWNATATALEAVATDLDTLELSSLDGVTLSSPVDGNLLTYNGSAWVNAVPAVPAVPAGSVLQVVSTTLTSTFTTASRSYTPLTGLSATITPSATSSKIMIWVSIQGVTDTEGVTVGSRAAMFRLTGGNSAAFVGDAASDRNRGVASFPQVDGASQRVMLTASGNFEDSPSTTSATTYQVQVIQPSSGTLYINRSEEDIDAPVSPRGASTITLMEVAG